MGKIKTFSDRMKDYENCYSIKVPNRSYMVVRLDGVGFSKYTKQFEKPFDDLLSNVMDATTIELCKAFNPKFAYTQSDEISLIFTTIDNIDAELIFDGKIQKVSSILAGKATAIFNKKMLQMLTTLKYGEDEVINKIKLDDFKEIDAFFDARVFVIPDLTEVYNYFTWRQQDCTRNSISMAAHALLKGDLSGVNGDKKQERLFSEAGVNWNDYKIKYKRGVVIKKHTVELDVIGSDLPVTRSKWIPDYETPIFTKNKEYLQDLI